MIFTLVGEELGLIGMIVVIAAFGFIALAGLKIAMNAPSVMARCVAAGLTTMLIAQATFNIGAAMVVLPLAGMTLPLLATAVRVCWYASPPWASCTESRRTVNEPERSNHPRRPRILIAGGGTGGHAIPALCVAADLRERGAIVEFVGSSSGIEMSLVPQQGYTLHALPLTGLAGSPLAQARAGLLSLRATISCTRIIQRLRPLSVLGVGGYASAPAVIAARTLGVPTFLHEQNAVPGRVNRLASRFTTQTLATFPDATRRLGNAVWVGMPTRAEIFEASREEALRDLDLEPPVVLIFGGSGVRSGSTSRRRRRSGA